MSSTPAQKFVCPRCRTAFAEPSHFCRECGADMTRASALDAAPRYSGVGYVFAFSDPYTGIDLDGCLDADGQIADWAAAIVTRLDSYTELSPSGRGLHVIVRAALPPGGRRKGPIELYDCGRYFTMTADPLPGTREEIAERQREIAALHAELFGAADLVVQPRPKPTRQQIEPQCVRSVRQRVFRPIMHFEKNSVHSRGRSCPRQRLDEFRLAATGIALPSRQLYRMRYVKHHRAAGLRQHGD